MRQLEANIIYRLTKGDENALDSFMDFYSAHLYRQAFAIVGNREMAEEIVSDVFFEAWNQRRELLKIENLSAWLCKITYRKAVSAVRHEQVVDTGTDLDDETTQYHQIPVQSAEESMISQQEVDKINRAIEELKPQCRQVFMLAKLEKLPYKDISDILGISINTVNYHLKIAMDFLREKLRPDPPPD